MKHKRKNTQTKTVGFVALGCPKNMVDAEKMLSLIGQRGFVLTDDSENADAVVINTCGFIESARKEAFDAIKQVCKAKKRGNVDKIVVTGCLVQKLGKAMLERLKEVDAIVDLDSRDRIGDVLRNLFAGKGRASYLQEKFTAMHNDTERLLLSPSYWAYLRISEGCNRRCSFCTIPFIRGPFRSKPLEQILSEAAELVVNGVKEIILIAQDSSFYGRDFGQKDGLLRLLEELEKMEGLEWIRVMYLYPASLTDEIINKIAGSKKIVHYFDMPIQHINDDILEAMKRADTKANTTAVIEKIRAAMPDAVLRTTVIAGFPGETDEQFNELLEFIKWAKFDALGCFAYSREEGTDAYSMDNQVDEEIKQQRVEKIMLTQQQIAFDKNKQRMGQAFKCLVEKLGDEGFGWGRFFGQAPEIDNICLIEKLTASPGDFIDVRVIGSEEYDIVVEQITQTDRSGRFEK